MDASALNLSLFYQVFLDQQFQRFVIALERSDRGGYHFRRGHPVPPDSKAEFLREVANEKSLGPSVSFAEGVGGVDLTKIVGKPLRPFDLRCGGLLPKLTFGSQLDEGLAEVVFYVKV